MGLQDGPDPIWYLFAPKEGVGMGPSKGGGGRAGKEIATAEPAAAAIGKNTYFYSYFGQHVIAAKHPVLGLSQGWPLGEGLENGIWKGFYWGDAAASILRDSVLWPFA